MDKIASQFINFFTHRHLLIIFIISLAIFIIFIALLIVWQIFRKKNPAVMFMHNFFTGFFRFWIVYEVFLFVISISSCFAILWLNPKVISPSEPALGVTVISDEKPIIIELDRLFDKSKIQSEINPPLKGNWNFESNFFSNKSKLTFTPIETPVLDTRYTISLNHINNFLNKKNNNYLFSLQTPPVPKIISASIAEGEEGILPNTEIKIECEPIINKSAEFNFELLPETELDVAQNDSSFTIKPKENLHKGANYTLKGYRTLSTYNYETKAANDISEREEVLSINFKTMEAPGVKSTSPLGSGILTDSPVKVIFSQNMNRSNTEKAFSLSPQIDGSFSWSDDKTFTFKPSSSLAKNTRYTVTISTSAQAADYSNLEEAISFQFVTVGYARVSSFSPTNGAVNIEKTTNITVTFDQAVDHSSAENSFSISPQVSGNFSWNNNAMTYKHSDFNDNQKYTVSIAAGVKSTNGFDSKDIFSASFTTKTPSVSINVPAYHQAHMYSCMGSAARSALAAKGVSVSEDTVLNRIGYDSTAWSGTWNEGGAIWGDPDSGIVGSVDGSANNIGWGYGAHWTPVANAINSLGRSAEVKSGWSVSGIAAEIAAGNPVIIWWVNGVWPAYEVNWKTPGGKSIRGVNSMHVQVVKGFTGSVDDPQSFTVTDSGYGYPGKTFDVGTFKAKWSWFGNTGIVVR